MLQDSCVVAGDGLLLLSGGNWPWSYTGVLYISECRAAAHGVEHLEGRDGGVIGSSHGLAVMFVSWELDCAA